MNGTSAPSTQRIPAVSVIITTYNAERTVATCLDSITEQNTDSVYEIILVDSSSDSTPEIVRTHYPDVKLYRFSERKFCGDARNIGITASSGAIVAFIDADCVAEPNWLEEIIRAHKQPYPVIGGSIANGKPANLVSWASYFCEYSQWMPGHRSRFLEDMAGANASYKKELFSRHGSFIAGTYCSDTEFHWRIKRENTRIRFEPRIRIYHHSINRFGKFLNHEYHHGRSFARVRVTAQRFSLSRRVAYASISCCLPPLLIGRITLNILRSRVYGGYFMLSLPLLVLGVCFWSAGEFRGYLSK